MMPFKVSIEIDQRDVDALSEEILNDEQFKPVVFGFTAEHSEYMEFGTGPLRGRQSYVIGKEGRKEIDEWARLKVGITDEKERKKFVGAVANKIGKHGMEPRPFFRPAIDLIVADMENRIGRGESLEDMAEAIGDLANRIILAYDMPYTGDLVRSWFVMDLERYEITDKDSEKDFEKEMDNLWGKL